MGTKRGSSTSHFDYIIVGAGPAGLQMGYFLEKAGRSYLILEGKGSAGSFYSEFPRHRTLLSINKRFNGFPEADFNLRHDWNSLLSDDQAMLFKNYSEELYPNADDLYRYLQDFASHFSIKIEYNSRVVSVGKNSDSGFLLQTEVGSIYTCNRILMATGTVAPSVPAEIKGIEHVSGYEDHTIDPADYENKRVAIIGRGNSAFEVANHLAGHAAIIHVLVGVPVKHAWQTHYPGDLRAINNTIIDMYQLKSLHAVVGFRPREISKNANGTFHVVMEEDYPHWETPGTGTTTMTYDHIIRCTGWHYFDPSIFDDDCLPDSDTKDRYPVLSASWESTVPDLFYIGTAMQARDRRAASSFIHGFRYNVRTLFHLVEERYEKAPLPHETFEYARPDDLENLAMFIIRRVSTTSALFQLFGFLCDALVLSNEEGTLYYELPIDQILERDDFTAQEHLFLITLEYGFENYPKSAPTIDFIHPADASRPECSAYLHPVLRYYSRGQLVDEVHLGESLVVRYDHYDYEENYKDAYKNIVKNFLNRRSQVADEVFYDHVYTAEEELEVFTPWPEEKVRELKERDVHGEAKCKFIV